MQSRRGSALPPIGPNRTGAQATWPMQGGLPGQVGVAGPLPAGRADRSAPSGLAAIRSSPGPAPRDRWQSVVSQGNVRSHLLTPAEVHELRQMRNPSPPIRRCLELLYITLHLHEVQGAIEALPRGGRMAVEWEAVRSMLMRFEAVRPALLDLKLALPVLRAPECVGLYLARAYLEGPEALTEEAVLRCSRPAAALLRRYLVSMEHLKGLEEEEERKRREAERLEELAAEQRRRREEEQARILREEDERCQREDQERIQREAEQHRREEEERVRKREEMRVRREREERLRREEMQKRKQEEERAAVGMERYRSLPATWRSAIGSLFQLVQAAGSTRVSQECLRSIAAALRPTPAPGLQQAPGEALGGEGGSAVVTEEEFCARVAAHCRGADAARFDGAMLAARAVVVEAGGLAAAARARALPEARRRALLDLFLLLHCSVTAAELHLLCACFRIDCAEEKWRRVYERVAWGSGGELSEAEFVAFLGDCTAPASDAAFAAATEAARLAASAAAATRELDKHAARLQELFRQLDVDGAGSVPRQALATVGPLLDPHWTDERARGLLAAIDIDIGDRISEQAFLAVMTEYTRTMPASSFEDAMGKMTREVESWKAAHEERVCREEEERIQREEEEQRMQREEEERMRREEEQRLQREIQERMRKEEEDRRRREEEERSRREEEVERLRKERTERIRRQEQQIKHEEEERIRRAQQDMIRLEEERQRRLEEERIRAERDKEEQERMRREREEAERRRREEEARLIREREAEEQQRRHAEEERRCSQQSEVSRGLRAAAERVRQANRRRKSEIKVAKKKEAEVAKARKAAQEALAEVRRVQGGGMRRRESIGRVPEAPLGSTATAGRRQPEAAEQAPVDSAHVDSDGGEEEVVWNHLQWEQEFRERERASKEREAKAKAESADDRARRQRTERALREREKIERELQQKAEQARQREVQQQQEVQQAIQLAEDMDIDVDEEQAQSPEAETAVEYALALLMWEGWRGRAEMEQVAVDIVRKKVEKAKLAKAEQERKRQEHNEWLKRLEEEHKQMEEKMMMIMEANQSGRGTGFERVYERMPI